MVDTQLLDEKIKESGVKKTSLYEAMGISHNGFYKKLRGKTPWRMSEIFVIKTMCRLSDADANNIFFANESTERVTEDAKNNRTE